MTFWTWFKSDGDKVFTFFSLASLALQGVTDLPQAVMRGALIAGILATAAHQSFFPASTTQSPIATTPFPPTSTPTTPPV